MIGAHRREAMWFAAALHRWSGLALVLFVPIHFFVLSLALTDPESLDGFLHWSQQPLLKFVEIGLVFALAVHLFGGLRLLALEFLPWRPWQKTLAASATAAAFFVACGFALRAIG